MATKVFLIELVAEQPDLMRPRYLCAHGDKDDASFAWTVDDLAAKRFRSRELALDYAREHLSGGVRIEPLNV